MKLFVIFFILALFFANNESSNSAEMAGQKCDNVSCKNMHRYKKSNRDSEDQEGTHYIECNVCEGVPLDAPCGGQFCREYLNSSSETQKFKCLVASGTIDGKKMKYKTCITVGSGLCEELKKKGYESCSTCQKDFCSYLHCYECEKNLEMNLNPFISTFSDCNNIIPKICFDDAARCYSAKSKINGYNVVWKDCVDRGDVANLTKYLEYYGFSYYFCDGELCNHNA